MTGLEAITKDVEISKEMKEKVARKAKYDELFEGEKIKVD